MLETNKTFTSVACDDHLIANFILRIISASLIMAFFCVTLFVTTITTIT